ncbi:unnamed protein product [Cylindrotheca closterium]|uniref:Uncharacterized protein n=1 Tax=Cylindrotheca closterium TaxID=2856 RepID=A0AAD2JHF0_9STRA|nr:unnamed protein product [Cylindrotheca closterium]
MSGQRVTRRNKSSPSNLKLPDMKRMSENKQRIVENSKFHELFDDCELINSMFGLKETKRRNSLFRERAMRTISLTPGKLASLRGSVMGSLNMVEPAKELDMDHVYVGFFDFLWAYTFIGPCSYYLWKKGTLMLRLRDYLSSNGYITPAPCDYESMCATLLLEQTQAIHYYARTNPDSERGNVAGFYFANFPYVDENCEYRVADLFAVEIDLDTKKFVDGKLDDLVLNASETMILLWFNTIAAQHVKLHSTANWGLNLDETLEDVNPFFRRNSVVTVMYNFFGYTCFNRFMRIWADEGMVSEGWANEDKPFVQCVNHGIEDNVWQHSQIKELVKYSDFIHFVVSVRAIFMSEFAKCKHMFPGTDGEAMFVGTVLHSLDHTLMDWNMVDPLWLDVDDPRFGKMAEVGRVVKAGFVSDVPGLYFHKRFKGSGHPFYETVYAKAAKINKKLADHMDTCIIK